MRSLFVGLAAIALITSAGWTQPPEGGKGKGPREGGKGEKGDKAGPRFQMGRVLPPMMRDRLDLSEEQKRMIDDLEKDVKNRLSKILTEEQKKKLDQMPGPGGFDKGSPDGKGGDDKDRPKGKFKGKDKDKDGPPPGDEPNTAANGGGIQWFATLERGRAEAERTGKPILFVAAAPHCGGISGIW